MSKKVTYRTHLGAENYTPKALEMKGVRTARPALINLDPPQWAVAVRMKDGREGWALPNQRGVELR